MDTANVPRTLTQHQPAGSQPYFPIQDADTPSSSRGRPCAAGVDRRCRWVHSVAAGGIFFFVFLLAASRVAIPAASLLLHPYRSSSATHLPSPPASPRFAYLISGSAGEAGMLRRCLLALYHPRNHYVLHLDAEASDSERADLAAFVAAHPVLAAVRNVRVAEKANLGTYRGITTTLHAAAAFLRGPGAVGWDWFINLSASDYPLVTQDDLMDVFSRLPRDLNFIDHTSADMGSARTVLSRPFVEHLIRGWENLPHTTLPNFASSPESEGYFQTAACNADEFRNTTVNHGMNYVSWGEDTPVPGRQRHPELINSGHWDRMLGSDAPFARKFGEDDDPVLDRIDAELLSRQPGMLAPGSWGIGDMGGDGSLWMVRDAAPLRPGPGAARLRRLVASLLSDQNLRPKQCKIVVDHNAA